MKEFVVSRSDISASQLIDSEEPALEPNQARLAIERFALTANNITYGVAGDRIGYWKFFPAAEHWGKVPVWGIANVVDAGDAELEVGARYYGYFPMSQQLIMTPQKISNRGFVDGAEHRKELPPVYNQYSSMAGAEPNDHADNHRMIYAPLFTTSFILDDYFLDNADFGAKQFVIGSASSKTAIGLAFQLKLSGRAKVTGLTSVKNKPFVIGLGLYDEVIAYDEIDSLATTEPTAYVDMSGNREVLSNLHHRLSISLVYSCAVGITHWGATQGLDPSALPGPKPTMFFAPSQIVKRNQEWGPQEFQTRLEEATRKFLYRVDDWITVSESPFSEIGSTYEKVLNGLPPEQACIVVV